jgi:ribonuclease HI
VAEERTKETAPPLTRVEAWCDGACSGNPGPGGWGAVLTLGTRERELSGNAHHTTNNRMELTAAIELLRALKRPCHVVITTDSQYVIKGMEEWMAGWVRRGWRNSQNKPVENRDLWEALREAADRHQVEWRWTRGHAGEPMNERCDALAREAIARL